MPNKVGDHGVSLSTLVAKSKFWYYHPLGVRTHYIHPHLFCFTIKICFLFQGDDLQALLAQIPMNTSNIHSHRDRLDRNDGRLNQHEEVLEAHRESINIVNERLEHQRERLEELEIPNCECQNNNFLGSHCTSCRKKWYTWVSGGFCTFHVKLPSPWIETKLTYWADTSLFSTGLTTFL